jgi:hypothetical protein
MPRKVFPFPEAIDEQDSWEVREGPPHINFEKQYISVPLDDDPSARFLRAHELAHLKWTPGKNEEELAEGKDLGWATVQAVEDNRMHALLATVGIDMSPGGMKPQERKGLIDTLIKTNNFRDATLCAVASYGTGDYHDLAAAFENTPLANALQLAAEVRWRIANGGGGINDFSNGMSVARWLEGVIGKDPSRYPGKLFGVPGGQLHPLVRMYGAPSVVTDDCPTVVDVEEGLPGLGEHVPIPGLVPWGTMSIDEPERPLPACPRKAGYRAEDTGAVLRGAHRLLTDKRVFAVKRKHKGCSVLVDYSGSMNLKEAEVERILANAPATVIAVYSADREKGVLRILAKDGRRVTGDLVKRPSGSCNVIDGPALDWLARQDEPRFWLSDGLVTGVGDAAGTGNTVYANRVTQDAKVTRCRTTAELLVAIRRAARAHRRAPGS